MAAVIGHAARLVFTVSMGKKISITQKFARTKTIFIYMQHLYEGRTRTVQTTAMKIIICWIQC